MSEDKKDIGEEIEAVMKKLPIGETGTFPDGKLNEQDQGAIQIAVGTMKNHVTLLFGKPVAWLALTPYQARKIAEFLVIKAALLEGGANAGAEKVQDHA